MGDNVTETLAAPVGTEAQRIGAAVRERRLALGISQKSLAITAALPAAQTVSENEKGDRELKAVELVRVARALHVEPSELLGVETRTNADPRVLWRRGSRPLDRVREAQLLERARRYAQLEQWCNEVAQRRLPDYEFNPATATYRDVEHLAARVREEMKLGPVPERTLLRSLEEDFGVKVFFEHLDAESDGDCSAACVRSSEFGAAILMDGVEVPWRRLFSFAHELFHLVTWTAVEQTWAASGATGVEEPSWYKRLESYADTFAANVLMPEESLTSRFDSKVRDGKISRSDIVQLAVDSASPLRRSSSASRRSGVSLEHRESCYCTIPRCKRCARPCSPNHHRSECRCRRDSRRSRARPISDVRSASRLSQNISNG